MDKNKKQASILIVSMLILGAILVIGLNLALISVKEKKVSISSDESNISYQLAEQGVEEIMQKLLSVSRIAELSGIFDEECENGKIIRSRTDGIYEVVFLKDDGEGNQVAAGCSDAIGNITSIKSIGTLGNKKQKRAIQAPVVFPPEDTGCIPLTCNDISQECGDFDDGCNGTTVCGCGGNACCSNSCCGGGQICYGGTGNCCTPSACTPATCGQTLDSCGVSLTCPACCTNECSTSGAKECYSNGYRTCGNYDADSCLEWSSVTACSLGCTGGVCNSCTNECSTSGARECYSNGYRTCGNYDADSCLEWSGVTACTYGCSSGTCSSCTPSGCDGRCGSVDNGCGEIIDCGSCYVWRVIEGDPYAVCNFSGCTQTECWQCGYSWNNCSGINQWAGTACSDPERCCLCFGTNEQIKCQPR